MAPRTEMHRSRQQWPTCPPSPPNPASLPHTLRTQSQTSAAHPQSPPATMPSVSPSSRNSPCTTGLDRAFSALVIPQALSSSPASAAPLAPSSARTPSSPTHTTHGQSQQPSHSAPPHTSYSSHTLPHQVHPHPHSPHSTAPVAIPPQALSPPTPAPSPTPTDRWVYNPLVAGADDGSSLTSISTEDRVSDVVEAKAVHTPSRGSTDELVQQFRSLGQFQRLSFLSSLIEELDLREAVAVSAKIAPRLKRDFLRELPVEVALLCLSYIDDASTLTNAMRVSKYWNYLLQDERLWKSMFDRRLYRPPLPRDTLPNPPPVPATPPSPLNANAPPTATSPTKDRGQAWHPAFNPRIQRHVQPPKSFRDKFRDAYVAESNWMGGGTLLMQHPNLGDTVVTSLVVNDEYIIIGMANSKIHVFDAMTGRYRRALIGHEAGVWALVLVSPRRSERSRTYPAPDSPREDREPEYRRKSYGGASPPDTSGSLFATICNTVSGGARVEPASPTQSRRLPSSDVCGSAVSWGVKRPLVVSGGCDRDVRVWDIVTGDCLFSLRGHSSTIRCLKVLDGRPIAVSGSRDYTLRVWDIDRGRLLRVLEGHEHSVRCIEVAGNQVVSGSYDFTCRLWDVDTGQCLQVFEGHYHQIYAVAFDGERVVSGSLDSTVRVWDAQSGECLAILPGHTSLVGQLQLSGDRLITGGSDGRVIVFDLSDLNAPNLCVHRLCAHDNSVTCLQFDDRFIVSGGNDGRVKLWDIKTGTLIRELTQPCEAVWRVCFRDDKCAILCKRDGKTALEVLSFRGVQQITAA